MDTRFPTLARQTQTISLSVHIPAVLNMVEERVGSSEKKWTGIERFHSRHVISEPVFPPKQKNMFA